MLKWSFFFFYREFILSLSSPERVEVTKKKRTPDRWEKTRETDSRTDKLLDDENIR